MTARFRVEYLMEAALLGIFMISACAFTVLLDYPASPVRLAVPDADLRRLLIGLAMGTTAVTLIYSPWGMQSGAHFNPATTLTFFRLGKVRRRDALGYLGAQFAGAAAGVGIAWAVLGPRLADPTTHFATTVPGAKGVAAAFFAEVVISFLLMSVILRVSNHGRFARYTGLCAGIMVALFITLEGPLSGMSMNPARTLGSALFARDWTALWIYFVAPPAGMLAAAELYLRQRGPGAVFCAKLHHQNRKRCIFCEARRPVPDGTFSSVPAFQPPDDTIARTSAHARGERRMKRRIWIGGFVVLGLVGWYLFRPELLFVNKQVHEEQVASIGASVTRELAAGRFHSVAHETHGTATIQDIGGGRRVLRLTEFATSNGPDVRVYLVAATDASDNATVTKAGFVELGELKGNEGDQNYDVPDDLDLSRYRAVTIWCRRFSVNFATAPLTPAS